MADRTYTRREACRVGVLTAAGLAGTACGGTAVAGPSESQGSSPGARPTNVAKNPRVTKLVPGKGRATGEFGWAVAMDGSTAVVAVKRADEPNGHDAGMALVFERTGAGWTRTARLVPDDGDENDRFGCDVAVDGDTVVVGARFDDDPNGVNAGSAYVFRRSDGGWRREAKLAPDDADREDHFGRSVALDGDTAVVGAHLEDGPNGRGRGSAHVFQRSDEEWRRQEKLVPDEVAAGDCFGAAVALDGATALIGARGANEAFVYRREDRIWNREARLTPLRENPDTETYFGSSADLVDGIALVGAPGHTTRLYAGRSSGLVYRFGRGEERWRRETVLRAFDGHSGDEFGRAVATSGKGSIVGAPFDRRSGTSTGSAYVFDRGTSATDAESTTTEAVDEGGRSLPGFGTGVAVFGLGGGYLWKRIRDRRD